MQGHFLRLTARVEGLGRMGILLHYQALNKLHQLDFNSQLSHVEPIKPFMSTIYQKHVFNFLAILLELKNGEKKVMSNVGFVNSI